MTPAMNTSSSLYLLVFHDSPHESLQKASPSCLGAMLTEWLEWYDRLDAADIVSFRCPVSPECRVISGEDGRRVVDGPFPDSKNTIVGYFVLSARDLNEATEIVRGCPGLPHGMIVELRPAFAAPALRRERIPDFSKST
jgi:hypothetical protein